MSFLDRFRVRKQSKQLQTEIAACLPVFDQLADQLTAIAGEVETKVVETCSSLGTVVSRTKQVVESASTCLDGGDGNMGGEELIATTRTALTRLLTVTECLGEVGRIAESVRLVALNGRIEAARAGKHGDAFSVVASETNVLANKAMETSQTVRQTIEELEGLLQSSDAQQSSARSARCSELISEILRQLDIHNSIISSGMADLARSSDEIAKEVSHAIIALQFQDSVNQRLEHVVTSIREICAALRPLAADAGSEHVKRRTNEWNACVQKHYTMSAEHAVGTAQNSEEQSSSVELF